MDNNKPISILNNSNKGLLVAFIILIISIALIFFGSSLENKNEDIVAKNYDTLIANKQDNTNEYVKINIAYPPYLFAEESDEYGGKKYYLVFDNNKYAYIARLTDSTFNKLEEEYNNNQTVSYELKGYLFKQEPDLTELAINAYKDIFTESDITKANYELYFGKSYLDETITPSTNLEAITIGIGVGLVLLSFFIFIFSIVFKIRFKKNLKKYSKEELEKELLNPNCLYFKKQNICLTDKYIVSTMAGLDVIKYEDILWLYYENRRYNFVSIGKYIIARTKNKKMYQLAYSYSNEELLIEIMKKIAEKNDQILLGFTKENQQKYKELTSKKNNN